MAALTHSSTLSARLCAAVQAHFTPEARAARQALRKAKSDADTDRLFETIRSARDLIAGGRRHGS